MTSDRTTAGDRLRTIADELQSSHDIQVKATSRILGAAAQLAQNHDLLIEEVVDMVEADLQQPPALLPKPLTADSLKQQFASLQEAKKHFDIKARSWAALASKLNGTNPAAKPQDKVPQSSVAGRLEAIETELQEVRASLAEISQQLVLLLKQRQ